MKRLGYAVAGLAGTLAVLAGLAVGWVLLAHAMDGAMHHPTVTATAPTVPYTPTPLLPAAAKGKAAGTSPAGLVSALLGHGGHGGALWWLTGNGGRNRGGGQRDRQQ